MTKEDDILVRIGGQTHRLRVDDPQSLQKIPWSQRKRLIEVLEAMKKAEYIDTATAETAKVKPMTDESPTSANKLKPVAQMKPDIPNPPIQDSDVMMQRFLAEQKNYKRSIPGKAAIYKWFLIIFTVIFLLVLIL